MNENADAWLTFGVGWLLSALCYTLWRASSQWYLWFAVALTILIDLPHVVQTTVRVCLDAGERALHFTRYVVSLCVSALVVSVLMASNNVAPLVFTWLMWQIVHVARQHWGMIAIYARRAGNRASLGSASSLLAMGIIAPVTGRLVLGFAGAAHLGNGIEFHVAPLPVQYQIVAVCAVYGGFLGALAAFGVAWVRYTQVAEPFLPPVALATLVTAVVTYNVCYLLIDDLVASALITTIVHSLQYHAITWRHWTGRRKRSTKASDGHAEAYFPDMIVAGAFLIACASLLATSQLVLAGAVPLTFFFQHYYMDAFLWRRDKNPYLARDLGIPGMTTTE